MCIVLFVRHVEFINLHVYLFFSFLFLLHSNFILNEHLAAPVITTCIIFIYMYAGVQ